LGFLGLGITCRQKFLIAVFGGSASLIWFKPTFLLAMEASTNNCERSDLIKLKVKVNAEIKDKLSLQ
jgi:hypothetical protein